jgi:lipopolysaccharide transport system permease protein
MTDRDTVLMNGERRRRQLRLSPIRIATNDFSRAFLGSPVWWYLAWHDIKQRYRRSILGPLWLTVSTGLMIGAMGPLYGMLFNQPMSTYFQHLAVSFVVWSFVASTITEGCTAFVVAEGYIKEVALPFVTHVARVLVRNVIIFAHNMLVVVVVLAVFSPDQWLLCLLALPGLVLLVVNLFWVITILALVSARFRDIPQIVAAVVQVAFFLTPVVWKSEMLGPNSYLSYYNPLFHLVEVVRTPLLGRYAASVTWYALAISAVVGTSVAMLLLGRFRSRIAYWI